MKWSCKVFGHKWCFMSAGMNAKGNYSAAFHCSKCMEVKSLSWDKPPLRTMHDKMAETAIEAMNKCSAAIEESQD